MGGISFSYFASNFIFICLLYFHHLSPSPPSRFNDPINPSLSCAVCAFRSPRLAPTFDHIRSQGSASVASSLYVYVYVQVLFYLVYSFNNFSPLLAVNARPGPPVVSLSPLLRSILHRTVCSFNRLFPLLFSVVFCFHLFLLLLLWNPSPPFVPPRLPHRPRFSFLIYLLVRSRSLLARGEFYLSFTQPTSPSSSRAPAFYMKHETAKHTH